MARHDVVGDALAVDAGELAEVLVLDEQRPTLDLPSRCPGSTGGVPLWVVRVGRSPSCAVTSAPPQ
jgi:hypothetical protein